MVHSICRLHAVVLYSGLLSIIPVRWYDGNGLMEYFICSKVKSRTKNQKEYWARQSFMWILTCFQLVHGEISLNWLGICVDNNIESPLYIIFIS
uniref:Uncharacterized protein n=1 Tax=Salix viminalis TaxID=40686 RepID=A0A6N2M885_SALVM